MSMLNIHKQDAKEILENEYTTGNYLSIIDELIPDFKSSIPDFMSSSSDFDPIYPEVEYNGNLFEVVYKLGESDICDLTVYEVMLGESTINSRVKITQEMFHILKGQTVYNALISFVEPDKSHYRISLLTSDFEKDENGRYVTVLSNPRRYSYSLGCGTKTRTAYEFLLSKGKVDSIKSLINRFSIEPVNEQFYREIAGFYMQLIGGTTDRARGIPPVLEINGVDDKTKYSEFSVRLIGRIIFCWFLKEKKSEKEKPLIPEDLFKSNNVSGYGNYFHDVLEPLFYEVLNTPMPERKEWVKSNDLYCSVPYLNGGLFSPHDDDHYVSLDSVRCGKKTEVSIPNEWFSNFYAVLEEYNFTVDEDTSYDVELSIDPEMLGRIFENLLAEIIPETGEAARNNTGSFYTPRDIVDFMVDSSLNRYLTEKTGIEATRIESLTNYAGDESLNFNEVEKEKILKALSSITVLDPACGSGAFPMGMLQKIVYILQTIDPVAEKWHNIIIESANDSLKSDIEKYYQARSYDYIRKLTVIQNSVFGVDIQPIAVEIARLRCFLSLIIEEKISDDEPNRGISPLPNLEFKFVIANTLLPLIGEEGTDYQISMFVNDKHVDELETIRKDYFNVNDADEKKNLQSEFAKVQETMRIENEEDIDRRAKGKKGINAITKYDQLYKWRPFTNESTDWFNPKWMFGVTGGFDIVIGNPPYIRFDQGHEELKALYDGRGFESFVKTGNIYCLFYEIGCRYLKTGGILTYITSNQWIRAEYGSELRTLLAKYNPLLLVDFADQQIFKAAAVNTNILLIAKEENEGATQACIARDTRGADLSVFIRQNSCVRSFKTGSAWVILTLEEEPIWKKISDSGKQIKDWNVTIRRGILTGLAAYIISGDQRKDLIEKGDDGEIIQPVLQGYNIHRYGYEYDDQWLINVHNGIRRENIPPIDIDDHPAIKKYLDGFPKLLTRADRGVTPYNLRNCAFLKEFSKQKIVWAEISSEPRFAIDLNGEFLVEATAFMMVGDDLKYLLCFLNSSLSEFFFSKYATTIGEALRWKKYLVNCIPVPVVSSDVKKEFEELLDALLAAESDDEKNKYFQQIDEKIYGLYEFSDTEISVMERAIQEKKTKQKDETVNR